MASKTIHLINTFHCTEAFATASLPEVQPVEGGPIYYISERTARRLRSELCPVADCYCGGEFGQRGGEAINITRYAPGGHYVISFPDEESEWEAGS